MLMGNEDVSGKDRITAARVAPGDFSAHYKGETEAFLKIMLTFLHGFLYLKKKKSFTGLLTLLMFVILKLFAS